MASRRIVTAAGLSLFALCLCACAHEDAYGRGYQKPGYDYGSGARFGNHDWRFGRVDRTDNDELSHWYY